MKKFIFLFLILSICLCGLFACGSDEDLTAEFNSNIKYAYATYNEECDLSKYVEQKDGVTYSLEAVQVDVKHSMKTVYLKTEGLKFTPTLLDDAFVTLVAEKGNNIVKSKEITLSVKKPKDQIVERMVTSWHDSNFTVTVNVDPLYIKGEKSTSAKFAWFGSEPSFVDRFQYFATLMGDEVTDFYSVTNWQDAVISFWVYNPTDYDLEISPIWSHSGAELVLENDIRTIQTAKANSWSEIKYSLAYYGITENFYYDDATYKSYSTDQVEYGIGVAPNGKNAINQNWWTVRWVGRKDYAVSVPYFYEFYVSDFDIRNYDSVVDSDLDHTLSKFDKSFVYSEGVLIPLPQKAQSKDKLSFEVKLYGEGKTRFCVIQDWEKYVGYFEFDVNNSKINSEGVTTSLKQGSTDIYIINVDLSYGLFNDGANKSTEFNSLYFSGSEAKALVKNITVTLGEETDEERFFPYVTKNIPCPFSNPSAVSFDYKIENDGHIALCFLDERGEDFYGYFDFFKYGELIQETYNGITISESKDGFVHVEAIFSELTKNGGKKPSSIYQIYIRGDDYTDASGVVKNIVWAN